MTNQKLLRRSLLSSIIAIIVCFAMFLGTTFAWFTDSVTSKSNKIVAGTLKIDLEVLGDNGEYTSVRDMTDPIFNYDRWEPGYTTVKTLKIQNEGNLALKYQLDVTASNANCILADVIEVYMCFGESNGTYFMDGNWWYCGTLAEMMENPDGFTQGKLLPADANYDGDLLGYNGVAIGEITATIALHMQETAGNEYQGLDLGNIDVKLSATQYDFEKDSYGKDYDASTGFIKERGTYGGVDYTLDYNGTLSIAPASNPVADANSGQEFDSGAWREAVQYDSEGNAKAIGGWICNVSEVKSLVLAEGITSIGSFTAKFPNLTGEVVIPSTVTYIGQEAFQNTKITKLTFAAGGTEPLCIAPGAFKGLEIKEVVFPDDRPEIHLHCWAFNDCTKLESVTLSANITTFSGWTHVDYCGMDYVNGWDSQIFARCVALKKLIFVGETVKNLFFAAANNTGNINAIGNVEIIVI